ncbi:DUF5994 family protein [Streptomyces iakyrus]|uniref:DUF5994 family protein n=1 Tax=Streptomyces iakyrus TaxID=68219 RepID=UPI003F4B41E8
MPDPGSPPPAGRIGLDSAAWDEMPTRMTVDDRVVHIDVLSVGDDTALVTRGDQDHFSLLVVPPDTPPEAARAAVTEAVRSGNPKPLSATFAPNGADAAVTARVASRAA